MTTNFDKCLVPKQVFSLLQFISNITKSSQSNIRLEPDVKSQEPRLAKMWCIHWPNLVCKIVRLAPVSNVDKNQSKVSRIQSIPQNLNKFQNKNNK